MHAGKKIKELRLRNKMNVSALAKKLDLKSRQSIYDYEKRENISYKILKKIAGIFNENVLVFYVDDFETLNNIPYADLIKKYIKVLEQNIEMNQRITELERCKEG